MKEDTLLFVFTKSQTSNYGFDHPVTNVDFARSFNPHISP